MNEQQEGRLVERIEHIVEKVTRIDRTIHGNGREGLVVQVDRHDRALKYIGKILVISLTALVGLISAGIVALL